MLRRDVFATLAGLFAVTATREARAEKSPGLTHAEYLDRIALLIDENRRAQDWIGARPTDTGLASLALELAESRSAAGMRLIPPKELKGAHMHMLLALENTVASFDASARGDSKRAILRMSAARAEATTMVNALDSLKLKLPK